MQSGSSSREAALNAELERKFGKNPATGSELSGGDTAVAADDASPAILSFAAKAAAAAAAPPGQGSGSGESGEVEKSGGKGRRRRARKRGRRGAGPEVDVSAIDSTVSQGRARAIHQDSSPRGGAPAERPQSNDVEVLIGSLASGEAAGECTDTRRRGRRGKSTSNAAAAAANPQSSRSVDGKEGGEGGGEGRGATETRRGRSATKGGSMGTEVSAPAPALATEAAPPALAAAAAGGGGGGGKGEGGSHYQKQRSAWKNVHTKWRLTSLLKGLGSDYGVQQMLGAHHISQVWWRLIDFVCISMQ